MKARILPRATLALLDEKLRIVGAQEVELVRDGACGVAVKPGQYIYQHTRTATIVGCALLHLNHIICSYPDLICRPLTVCSGDTTTIHFQEDH